MTHLGLRAKPFGRLATLTGPQIHIADRLGNGWRSFIFITHSTQHLTLLFPFAYINLFLTVKSRYPSRAKLQFLPAAQIRSPGDRHGTDTQAPSEHWLLRYIRKQSQISDQKTARLRKRTTLTMRTPERMNRNHSALAAARLRKRTALSIAHSIRPRYYPTNDVAWTSTMRYHAPSKS